MSYSSGDIGNMRRDALRRTREMNRQNSNHSDTAGTVDRERCSDEKTLPPKVQVKSETAGENRSAGSSSAPLKRQQAQSGGLNDFFSGIFSGGNLDSDKIIIIALIIILAKDGADLKLLIALGYILL